METELGVIEVRHPGQVKLVLPIEIRNERELLAIEEKCLGDGFEGVMIRSVDGPYKEGRSTEREGVSS